jgi:hypothetical protein
MAAIGCPPTKTMNRALEYCVAAEDAARAPVADDQARDALAARVATLDGAARDEQVTALAVASLSVRDDYLTDRAYRLLTAVLDGRPVRPIDPAAAEAFIRQQRWCRLSLREAFADVVSVDPQVQAIVSAAVRGRRRLSSGDFRGLLGASAQNPLLMSDIALNVALRYADAMSGLGPREYLDKPYATMTPRARTGDFFGTMRPAASN